MIFILWYMGIAFNLVVEPLLKSNGRCPLCKCGACPAQTKSNTSVNNEALDGHDSAHATPQGSPSPRGIANTLQRAVEVVAEDIQEFGHDIETAAENVIEAASGDATEAAAADETHFEESADE